MHDFIKTLTLNINFDRLKEQLKVHFTTRIDTTTGELIPYYNKNGIQTYWHTAILGELKFIVKERIQGSRKNYLLIVQGSIHKNHFKGSNFYDFTLSNAVEQINLLSEITGIKPKDFILQNLEFGVNIQTLFPPFEYLNDNLITDKGEPFNMYTPDKKGVSIGFEHQLGHYYKKLYDKGLQYLSLFSTRSHQMRYELSFKKMQTLNKLGIYNLEDLTKPHKVEKLEQLLITKWNEILINDSLRTDIKIKKRDRAFLRNANNPKFWKQSKVNKTYREHRRKFKKLQRRCCIGTQDQLKEQIRAKFQHLLTH